MSGTGAGTESVSLIGLAHGDERVSPKPSSTLRRRVMNRPLGRSHLQEPRGRTVDGGVYPQTGRAEKLQPISPALDPQQCRHLEYSYLLPKDALVVHCGPSRFEVWPKPLVPPTPGCPTCLLGRLNQTNKQFDEAPAGRSCCARISPNCSRRGDERYVSLTGGDVVGVVSQLELGTGERPADVVRHEPAC